MLGGQSELIKLSDNKKINKSWVLVYIKQGRGMYIIEDDLRCLNEGDVILIPPNVSYSFTAEDLGDEYNVNLNAIVFTFDVSWLDAVLTAFPVCRSLVLKIREITNPYIVKGPKWIKIVGILDQLTCCSEHEQPLKILALLELISDPGDLIIIKNVQKFSPTDLAERISKIDRYIECNLCNRISLEDVSSYVGMSRIYFCNFFKSQYGEGFADYLNRLRIEKAVALLTNTDKTIDQIAHECGFKTVQYFTRSFAKVKQVTPGAFRRTTRM